MSMLNIGDSEAWMPNIIQIGSQKTLAQIIKSLFSDGTQGLYLNAQDAVSVSDLSSIKDLSGNNNHAVQANAASRASLITDLSGYKSLKFDGIDDGYATQSIDFTNTDKVTVIAAVRKLSDTSASIITELSADQTNNVGTFVLMPRQTGIAEGASFRSRGSIYNSILNASGLKAPLSTVLTAMASVSNDLSLLRSNGVQVGISNADQGTGNYGNHPLYIGRRAGTSLPFNGQIYALLVIGKLLDDATTQRIEKEFAKYIGVTL